MKGHGMLLALCCALAGCGGGPVKGGDTADDVQSAQLPLEKTLVYDCNGYDIVARVRPGEIALWLPDRYVVLPEVRSASGAKYEEGDVEFWCKGDDAFLTIGSEQYLGCAQQPWRVPWEDARRRGVDFRAVGNEPGWSLEIQSGQHLLFNGDYGMRRILIPDPGEHTRGQARTWHAGSGSMQLQVEIVDEPCVDTMSDETFPSRVTLVLDGETLRGCGRDLDYPWE